MSDEDKKRFIAAVTGADGKVNSKAAAALIAAAASGGDPEIANKGSILDFSWILILNYNFQTLISKVHSMNLCNSRNMAETSVLAKKHSFGQET